MKDVLLIGSSGYLGSELMCYLKRYGHNVTGIDVGWFGTNGSIKMDFNDLSVQDIAQYQFVILLASQSTVKMCNENPLCIKDSVYDFAELAKKCSIAGVKFVYSSSSAIYKNRLNAKETDIIEPSQDLYDFCMKSRDEIAAITPGLQYFGLRFGVLSGFSKNLRTDILLNSFVHSYLTHGVINMYNGDKHRSVLSIADACNAIATIIERENPIVGIYNLASFSATIFEMATYACNDFGCKLVVHPDVPTTDFTICTDKFRNNFAFEFEFGIDQILMSLRNNWHKTVTKTTRNV